VICFYFVLSYQPHVNFLINCTWSLNNLDIFQSTVAKKKKKNKKKNKIPKENGVDLANIGHEAGFEVGSDTVAEIADANSCASSPPRELPSLSLGTEANTTAALTAVNVSSSTFLPSSDVSASVTPRSAEAATVKLKIDGKESPSTIPADRPNNKSSMLTCIWLILF